MIMHVAAHVTLLLIAAFFILFAASKAEGLVKLLGNILGIWVFVIAVGLVVGCATAPMFGGKPFGMDMHGWHGGWMHHEGQPTEQPVQPAAPAQAPAPKRN